MEIDIDKIDSLIAKIHKNRTVRVRMYHGADRHEYQVKNDHLLKEPKFRECGSLTPEKITPAEVERRRLIPCATSLDADMIEYEKWAEKNCGVEYAKFIKRYTQIAMKPTKI